jgi:hypothetical protein
MDSDMRIGIAEIIYPSKALVPYHGGGRRKKINAWYLNILMVYL